MSNKYKLPVGALTDKDIKNAKNVADLRKAIKAGSLVGAGLISRKKKVTKKRTVSKRSVNRAGSRYGQR